MWAKTIKDNGAAAYKVDLSCFISAQRQIIVLLLERDSLYVLVLKLTIDGKFLNLKGWGPTGIVKDLDTF